MKIRSKTDQPVSCCSLLFTGQGIISSGLIRCGLAVAVCGLVSQGKPVEMLQFLLQYLAPGAPQYLDRESCQHLYYPSPRCLGLERACPSLSPRQTGQIFGIWGGQILRNRHRSHLVLSAAIRWSDVATEQRATRVDTGRRRQRVSAMKSGAPTLHLSSTWQPMTLQRSCCLPRNAPVAKPSRIRPVRALGRRHSHSRKACLKAFRLAVFRPRSTARRTRV